MKESDRNNRRSFLRKILTVTASAGVAGLLLDRLPGKSVIQPVQAVNPMNIDSANVGTGTTSLQSGGNPALTATNSGSGSAIQGTCTAGTGVMGIAGGTSTGTGVQGVASNSGGTALSGFAGDPGAIPIVAQGAASQTANLQEWRNGSGTMSVVDPNGRLGIGTRAPGYPFEVINTSSVYAMHLHTNAAYPTAIIFDSAAGQQAYMNFLDGGVQKFQVGKNTDNTFFFWDQLNTSIFLSVNPSSKVIALDPGALPYNVGIGTSAPAFKLDVAGAVHATSFPTSSDMRFKEEIQPIDNALDKVLRLNGVYFKWNHLHRETLKRSNTLTSRQVGLIAQQVKEVVPEIVSEWADQGAENYLAVDYSRLVAIMIEAVKEQQSTISRLTARISNLERTTRRLAAS
jgi:hypothetical protein